MSSAKKVSNSLWDDVYRRLYNAGKNGVTTDEIVKITGYNPKTVSSYLSHFVQGGYATKTNRFRTISSGREASVYVVVK